MIVRYNVYKSLVACGRRLGRVIAESQWAAQGHYFLRVLSIIRCFCLWHACWGLVSNLALTLTTHGLSEALVAIVSFRGALGHTLTFLDLVPSPSGVTRQRHWQPSLPQRWRIPSMSSRVSDIHIVVEA